MNPFATPERNRYFAGRLLGAGDLQREQEYHRAAASRTAWAAMGWGVVAGLGLTVAPGAQGPEVTVGPGLALDGMGREIVLPSPAVLQAGPAPPFTVLLAHAESRARRFRPSTARRPRRSVRSGRSRRCRG
ncbi:MAG: hypothetical protein AB7O78_06470 [Thermoleophilia bacterium]